MVQETALTWLELWLVNHIVPDFQFTQPLKDWKLESNLTRGVGMLNSSSKKLYSGKQSKAVEKKQK